jgi:signal recognition particle receptor subunit beta
MVQFNFSERTIKAKVVYYGPAQSGKTTNLEQIHRISDPAGTNRLISLNTAHDRTLFFDLLPFSLGAVAGYDFKVQLYTVPGQVQYNATRRVVLAGADAVVFVADSNRSLAAENQAAFENMKVNLLANRLVPDRIPLILQYNKRDLPDIHSEAELDRALNPWARRTFPAVAAEGRGVMETFVAIIQDMLASIASKYNLKEKGLDPATVPDVVAEAFAPILKRVAPPPPMGPAPSVPAPVVPTPAGPARVVVSQLTDTLAAAPGPALAAAEAGLISEDLLHRSIRSNVELAEALAGLVRDMNLGLGSIQSHAELLLLYRDEAREKRATAIASIQQEAARLRRIIQGLGQAGASAGETPLPHHASSSAPTPMPVPSASAAATPEAPPRTAVAAAGQSPSPAPGASLLPPRAAAPADTAPDAAPPPTRGDLAALLREVMQGLGQTFDSLGIAVDFRVSPGVALPPSCSAQDVRRALARMVEGVVTTINPASNLALRCERKTVLLRTRDGEVRKDFVMLGLGQAGSLSAEEQQRIIHGSDPGTLGQAARLVRGLGGFVRFAPLPSGGLETRVFLPAA